MGNRKRPHVWKYFKKVGENSNGKAKMSCNFCGCTYLGNATRMASHLQKCFGWKQAMGMEEMHQTDEINATNILANPTPERVFHTLFPDVKGTESIPKNICKMDSEDDPKRLLARAIFSSGFPFHFFEDHYWKLFFKSITPDLQLPSKESLANEYLEEEYRFIQQRVDDVIREARFLSIICQENGTDQYDLYVCTPKLIFYDTLQLQEHSPSESQLRPLELVICEFGTQKVVSIVFENPAGVALHDLKRLERKYPHLAIIFSINKIMENFYKKIMTMDPFSIAWNAVSNMVTKVGSELSSVHAQDPLILQIKSFCSSFVFDIFNLGKLLDNKTLFLEYATCYLDADDEEVSIHNDTIWNALGVLHTLLFPILSFLSNNETITVSEVVPLFVEIEKHFVCTLSENNISDQDRSRIQNVLKEHKASFVHPIHLATDLLDPRSKGSALTPDEQIASTEYIYALSTHCHHISAEDALADLANYRSCDGLWGTEYIWKAVKKIHPVSWWKGFCSNTQLARVAEMIFKLPAASTHAGHTSISGLTETHLFPSDPFQKQKLKYVSHNLHLLEGEWPDPKNSVSYEPMILFPKPEPCSSHFSVNSYH